MSDITKDYSFGGWLRHYRLKSGLTLRDAAKNMGMDAGNLSKLERSEFDPPSSAERVKFICEAVRCVGQEIVFLQSLAYQYHSAKLRENFFK